MSSEIAAIGVDVGNTNYTAALVSGAGQCIEVRQGKTDAAGGPDAMLRGLSGMLPELMEIARLRELAVKGIGVGFGGPVDFYAGRVVLSHQTPGWEGFPLRDRLAGMTGLRVVGLGSGALAPGEELGMSSTTTLAPALAGL
jgi:predicted NBD/HSP70 family sugar kinase